MSDLSHTEDQAVIKFNKAELCFWDYVKIIELILFQMMNLKFQRNIKQFFCLLFNLKCLCVPVYVHFAGIVSTGDEDEAEGPVEKANGQV